MAKGPKPKDPLERFYAKVKVNPSTGCHEWTGSINRGYAHFGYPRKNALAHRFAWEFIGNNPPAAELDHICNNRRCVNVAHLRTVNHRENMLAEHSNTIAKINSQKTHCPQGHELSGHNLMIHNKMKWRRCRLCANADQRKIRQRRKAVTPKPASNDITMMINLRGKNRSSWRKLPAVSQRDVS